MSGGKDDEEEEDVRMKERREKKRTPTRNWICHTIVDETMKQKRGKYLLPKKNIRLRNQLFSVRVCLSFSLSLSLCVVCACLMVKVSMFVLLRVDRLSDMCIQQISSLRE